MGGIGELKTQIAASLQEALREIARRTGGVAPEFSNLGFGPTLLVAALGQREDRRMRGDSGDFSPTRDIIDQTLAEAARRRGIPISPDDAGKVRDLVLSRELERNLDSGLGIGVRMLATLPGSLARDVLDARDLPGEVASALERELGGVGPDAIAILQALRRGDLTESPSGFPETVRLLLGRATARSVVQAARAVLAPDNEILRLALIVYARTQGFDLSEDDIDAVRTALDPDDPNLGLLLSRGFAKISDRFGDNQALNVIQRLGGR